MDGGNVISAGDRVDGTIRGAGSLTIAGRVEGRVELEGDLEVSSGAYVQADLNAAHVRVQGAVDGPIRARRSISLGPGAVVNGDLEAPSVAVDPEAQLVGQLRMPFELPREARGKRAAGRR